MEVRISFKTTKILLQLPGIGKTMTKALLGERDGQMD